MVKNVYYNVLHVIIVSKLRIYYNAPAEFFCFATVCRIFSKCAEDILIILGGIQSHPHERSKHQRFIEHAVSSTEVVINNSDRHHFIAVQDRESLLVNYETRIKTPVTDDSKYSEMEGKIIFPSDLHQYIAAPPTFKPSSVTVCKNTTFCEHPPYYPKDFIKIAIETRQDLKFLATVDTLPQFDLTRIQIDDVGENSDDVQLCASEDIVVFPKSAENEAKQWLYVINQEDFLQGVRIESCTTENTACSVIEGFVDGYKTFCKQKYIYRQLAAVSLNGSVGTDIFRFPASCCCHITFMGNPAMRMARIDVDKRELGSRAGATNSMTGEKNENK